MNQKIRELAEQYCYDEIGKDYSFYIGKDYSLYFNITKEKVEQFAELIIEECCNRVSYIDALEIKKHFGVE